jgi:hypothetical protein
VAYSCGTSRGRWRVDKQKTSCDPVCLGQTPVRLYMSSFTVQYADQILFLTAARTSSTPLGRRSTSSSIAASGAQTPTSPRKSMALDDSETAARIRALQDKFNYQGRGSMGSTNATISSGHGHAHTDSRSSRTSSIYDIQSPEVQAHLRALRNRDSMG